MRILLDALSPTLVPTFFQALSLSPFVSIYLSISFPRSCIPIFSLHLSRGRYHHLQGHHVESRRRPDPLRLARNEKSLPDVVDVGDHPADP